MGPFAIISLAISAASTYAQIQGQRMAAKAQQQAAEYQAQLSQQTAQWNADQMRKQAAYEESTAQKNMRRERENNRRELARRRASSARGGLAETGAVADNLIEASERHQQEIDDIWERASTIAHTQREKAQMSIWEGTHSAAMSRYQGQVARAKAKTDMWSTAIGGATDIATMGQKAGWFGG